MLTKSLPVVLSVGGTDMRRCPVFVCAALLTGCSVHPIPDDVSPIPTEEIVKSMRCETKGAEADRIAFELRKDNLDILPELVLLRENMDKIRRSNSKLAEKLLAYGASSIAYRFEFVITENDTIGGELAFKWPFTKGVFDLGASAGLEKERIGHRVFETAETFAELAKLDCANHGTIRDRNLIYPITGSIGMRKVVETFVELAEFGGAKGQFTDTLTFTTKIGGGIKPSVTLTPVPHSFRLVSANGEFSAGRVDKHEVLVSFAFPAIDLRDIYVDSAQRLARATSLFNAESRQRLAFDASQRALENLCIARANNREDEANTLRFFPPEYYCHKQYRTTATASRKFDD